MGYAVFKDGVQVSKVYPLREQAVTDAVERGFAYNPGLEGRAIGMKPAFFSNIEIKETENPNDQ
ncbi:hypothetical protein QWJ07_03810 [Frankia sp. RB7]|nr:hypothetical protein [Frankia sp. RB7]